MLTPLSQSTLSLTQTLEQAHQSSDMLKHMRFDATSNHFKQMQDNFLSEKIALKKKADDDLFFNLFMQLIQSIGHFDEFKNKLSNAAEQSGFANLPQALNEAQNNQGQTPLLVALLQQNFNLAKQLLDLGAMPGPEERAAFEIAKDSKAGQEFGFGAPQSPSDLPDIKKFGLVLGIQMEGQDGTYSQYSHQGPAYQLVTDALANYAKSQPTDKDFKSIAEAYNFSNKTAAFFNSTPQGSPEAGQLIADRIQKGQITSIPIGCRDHFMALSVVPDGSGSKSGYLVYTNRGVGAKSSDYGTQIYRIDDLTRIDKEFINHALNANVDGVAHDDVLKKVKELAGNKAPIHTIKQSGQKGDNCGVANPRSNVEGILLCQKATEKGGFEHITAEDKTAVKAKYKKFTQHMRTEKVNDLANALKKNPNDPDLNNVAKAYLKQHPNVDPALAKPIMDSLKGVPSTPSPKRPN